MDAVGAGDELEVQPSVLSIHTYHAGLAEALAPLDPIRWRRCVPGHTQPSTACKLQLGRVIFSSVSWLLLSVIIDRRASRY